MNASTLRAAVGNGQLRVLLGDVTTRFAHRRAEAVRAIESWESLRTEAARIKDESLANLDAVLVAFEQQATSHGARVFWANTAEDARQYVVDLARDVAERRGEAAGPARVVKSKSMVTEEVHLNDALAAEGMRVVETDLGEFIVQLAGERPSHVIAPAIHKTRHDVAQLFARKLGTPVTGDIEELTAEARRRLRDEFMTADLGVSGANFAVAETGTIVVVENEGNARLTTSTPPVHVALVGIEKMVPRIADLAVFLTLLPRSATGQPMSSYVSLLTGPRRAGELDGPEELHIVLVDNGRTRLLADAGAREALRCIRCGACQNVCPVYRHIGGHAYDAVYAGPIGSLVSPHLDAAHAPPDLPFLSSLCGACADVCPVKIDIPEVLLHLRREAMAGALPGPPMPARGAQRAAMRAWAAAMRTPRRYAWSFRLFRIMARVFTRNGRIRSLPGPFAGWTDVRDFPPPAGRSFQQIWRDRGRSS